MPRERDIPRPTSREGFGVAILCALPREASAVHAIFDEIYDNRFDSYGKQAGDTNTYTTGRIGQHHVALAHMPGMGVVSAAIVATGMAISFPKINLCLIVGICGGVPYTPDGKEVVLGDVVISSSVIHYDFGRQYPDVFVRKTDVKDVLRPPNPAIRGFIKTIQGRRGRLQLQKKLFRYLREIQSHPGTDARYPGVRHDRLHKASYRHKHRGVASATSCVCARCKSSKDPVCEDALSSDCTTIGCRRHLLLRERLKSRSPRPSVHVGIIASANAVVKCGERRDEVAKELNVIAFEMEGAGAWDSLPCVVIKGVCDYADSHKSKVWQGYAAATSASCARAWLDQWFPSHQQPDRQDTAHFVVPFARDIGFVERLYHSSRFQQINLENGTLSAHTPNMALFGLGGSGKTSLALELSYRSRIDCPLRSVFWMNASSAATFEDSCRVIGRHLHLLGSSEEGQDSKRLIKQHLSKNWENGWLMILDGVDDTEDWMMNPDGSKHYLWEYLPNNKHGRMIVTTRDRQIAVKFASKDVVEVEPLDYDTSSHLLQERLIQKDALGDQECTVALLGRLGSLPLAIVQAATYMNINDISLSQYLSLLEESDESLVEMLAEDFDDERRYQHQRNPVMETWEETFEYIRRRNILASDYLCMLSCVEPKLVSPDLLPLAQSRKKHLEALACLRALSMIHKQEDGIFQIHPLVRLAVRRWLSKKNALGDVLKSVSARFGQGVSNTELQVE